MKWSDSGFWGGKLLGLGGSKTKKMESDFWAFQEASNEDGAKNEDEFRFLDFGKSKE